MNTTDVRSTLRSRSTLVRPQRPGPALRAERPRPAVRAEWPRLALCAALFAAAAGLGCGLVGGGDDDSKGTDLGANGAPSNNTAARGPYGGSTAAAPAPERDDARGASVGAAGSSSLPEADDSDP